MLRKTMFSLVVLASLAPQSAVADSNGCTMDVGLGETTGRFTLASLQAGGMGDAPAVRASAQGGSLRLAQLIPGLAPTPRGPKGPTLCLRGIKHSVTCNANGTFALTLTTAAGIAGSVIELMPSSVPPNIVTAQPSQQTMSGGQTQTSWTLAGPLNFSATLIVNITQPGGGSVKGTDLCCLGTVRVQLACAPAVPDVTSVVCKPPMTKNPAGTACVCPAGMVQRGQTCVRQLVCNAPFVLNAAGNTCVCPPATTFRNRTCVKTPECKPPMILNERNNTCVCPAGTVQKGSECVRQIVCRAPMVANRDGTACECPQGTIQRAQTCVRDPGKGKGEPKGGGPRDGQPGRQSEFR
jgi:hypothetical protein